MAYSGSEQGTAAEVEMPMESIDRTAIPGRQWGQARFEEETGDGRYQEGQCEDVGLERVDESQGLCEDPKL